MFLRHRFFPFLLTFVSFTLLLSGTSAPSQNPGDPDRQAVIRLINKMEYYYEHRRLTPFIGLFSRRKFPNLISFRQAVENDFDTNTNITLRKSGGRLTVSHGMAVFQATWTKQFRPLLISPHEDRRMKRISGNVRIYFQKEKNGWKVINLQGYPIFGL